MVKQTGFVGRLFLTIALCLWVHGASAHEIRPSIADLNFLADGRFEISIQTNVEAMITGIGGEHEDTDEAANAPAYNQLRQLSSQELAARFAEFENRFLSDLNFGFNGQRFSGATVSVEIPATGDTDLARDSIVRVSGTLPKGASDFYWAWPRGYGSSVIRANSEPASGSEGYSSYLSDGEASETIRLEGRDTRPFLDVIWEYVVIGFTHILPKGLDHILFVVGLFLLSSKLSTLLWQVTAFTVAHTVTLALGILGYISISPAIVEPLIALSIVYVAVENILTDKLHRWRPVIIFGFGLLHGLGFAGVLQEIGLSSTHFVTGLLAFNVGVELGQFAVIALCYFAIGIWFGQKEWYRRLVTTPASVGIAVIASWWVYERVFL